MFSFQRTTLVQAALALAFTAATSSALAQTNPYEKGPAPSMASIQGDGCNSHSVADDMCYY